MSDKVATFQLTLRTSVDEREVFVYAEARMVPEAVAPTLDNNYIVTLLSNNGYGDYQINNEAIDEIISALDETLTQISSEADTEGLNFETNTIAVAADAEAIVEVPSDKMTALLTIRPSRGGDDLSMEQVKKALEEAEVTYGIDDGCIQKLLDEAMTTELDHIEAQVAFGREPVNGEDAKFIPLVPTANERILKPRLLDDGTVDMHDLGDLPTVKAGTHLMRKEPPTEGETGINVKYGYIAPKKGIDKSFKPGQGTEISSDDEFLLIATISGQPNLKDNGMKVDDAVQVAAVDLHTGNMILDANLLVKGDIGEGMKVRCEGDITVGGVIESADVKAKGNIIVGKGIIGRPHHDSKQHDYTCTVEAEGDISAMFSSYTKITTDGDLLIAEQLLHCDSTANGKVVVGNEKTVGSQIVGGVTRAHDGVHTDILGASAGVPTHIDLSGKLELKQMEISAVHSTIAGKEQSVQTMIEALSKSQMLPATPARQEHIQKIKNTIEFVKNEIAETEAIEQQVRKEVEELSEGIQITAKKKIQPNVTVKMGHHHFKNRREREAGSLFYQGGEIKYDSHID